MPSRSPMPIRTTRVSEPGAMPSRMVPYVALGMPGDDGEARGEAAVGHRNAGERGCG